MDSCYDDYKNIVMMPILFTGLVLCGTSYSVILSSVNVLWSNQMSLVWNKQNLWFIFKFLALSLIDARQSVNVIFWFQNGVADIFLFDAAILESLDYTKCKGSYKGGITPENPGENLKIRPLALGDYHNGNNMLDIHIKKICMLACTFLYNLEFK